MTAFFWMKSIFWMKLFIMPFLHATTGFLWDNIDWIYTFSLALGTFGAIIGTPLKGIVEPSLVRAVLSYWGGAMVIGLLLEAEGLVISWTGFT